MSEEDLERVVVMTDEPMSPSVYSFSTASATITSGDLQALEAARETNLNPPCWPVLRASHTSPSPTEFRELRCRERETEAGKQEGLGTGEAAARGQDCQGLQA